MSEMQLSNAAQLGDRPLSLRERDSSESALNDGNNLLNPHPSPLPQGEGIGVMAH